MAEIIPIHRPLKVKKKQFSVEKIEINRIDIWNLIKVEII